MSTTRKMDSFYPKIDEVELVLVDDDNDFYDPLETNFECEDENEDTKLQLNDAVYEENHFHWNTNDATNNSPENATDSVNPVEFIKQETTYENCDYKYDITSNQEVENVVESDENSNHSFDAGYENFQNNDSEHSSDVPIIELKPNPDELLKATTELKQNEKIPKSTEVEKTVVKEDIVKTEKNLNKKKHTKKRRKEDEEIVVASTSECSIKKEPKVKKKSPKEEKVVCSSLKEDKKKQI